jgi:hypothetical protein
MEHAHSNAGDKARHYLPENEPAPISETDYGIPTSSSTFNSTLHQPHSYLQYIGLAKYANATTMLQKMMEINLENP